MRVLLVVFLLLHSTTVFSETIAIACGSVGLEKQYCIESAQRWEQLTGHQVKIVNTPRSSTERLSMYKLLLREKHNSVDVFQIDVIWPGQLHKYLLDLSPYLEAQEAAQHFSSLIENNTVNDRLIALPWYVDVGVLYYRKDILEKYGFGEPTSFVELFNMLEAILPTERQTNPNLEGYIFQGDRYEGLTCNFVEWFGSSLGEAMLEKPLKLEQVNRFSAMLTMLRNNQEAMLIPADITSFREEEARLLFQEGNSVFMRNWPYAWNLMNDPSASAVADKVGVMPIPGFSDSDAPSTTLGGWQLAVSQYSEKKALAVDLVRFMTSQSEQRVRASLGYFPTRQRLYETSEPNTLEYVVGQSLVNAYPRPSSVLGRNYQKISRHIYTQTHTFLKNRDLSAGVFLSELSDAIKASTLNEQQLLD